MMETGTARYEHAHCSLVRRRDPYAGWSGGRWLITTGYPIGPALHFFSV